MMIVSGNHTSCLYYKSSIALALTLARVINYAPRGMLQIVALLISDSWSIIYNGNIFIEQALGMVK
jgi:hypothetical protein